MGCNSTRGFGDLEDDKKYVDNENKPNNDTNENAQDENSKENKNELLSNIELTTKAPKASLKNVLFN